MRQVISILVAFRERYHNGKQNAAGSHLKPASMRAVARRAQPPLDKHVITTRDLLEEIAVSQYSLHAGLHLQHITTVWRDLWGHVATQLRTGKVHKRLLQKQHAFLDTFVTLGRLSSRVFCCRPWAVSSCNPGGSVHSNSSCLCCT